MMANDCSDDSVLDFPPLFQTMRLNVEGGPMYRGGRSGRAAAAYYREKEVMIAIKNKHGNRYGRRILSYKPDTEAWKPERYQRRIDTLKTRTPEVIIPGGLQNRKPLIRFYHDRLEQPGARVEQQEGFSRGDHIPDKYSSETSKSEGVHVTADRTSHTVDLAELKRPFKQGRGMMRGKRVVDISAIYCADETEELTMNCVINPENRGTESNIQNVQRNTRNCESDQSPPELMKSDEKEEFVVNCTINPEKREYESSIQKVQGNITNCEFNQFPSELIKSDKKEFTVNCTINPEKREPENSIQQDLISSIHT